MTTISEKYLEGSAVRDSDNNLYVVINGQLSPISEEQEEEETEADQLSGMDIIPTLEPEELNRMAEGGAAAARAGVISASQGPEEVKSNMRGRFMSSTVRLSPSYGRLDGTTEIWTRQPWVGFTGGVIVLFGDVNGEILENGNSKLYQYGVDGFRIPFKISRRKVTWREQLDRSMAQKVRTLEIIHTHAPKDRFFSTLKTIAEQTKELAKIVSEIRGMF